MKGIKSKNNVNIACKNTVNQTFRIPKTLICYSTICFTVGTVWVLSQWESFFKYIRLENGLPMDAKRGIELSSSMKDGIVFGRMVVIGIGFLFSLFSRRINAILCQCGYIVGILGIVLGALFFDNEWSLHLGFTNISMSGSLFITIGFAIWSGVTPETLNSSIWLTELYDKRHTKLIVQLLNTGADASFMLARGYTWLHKKNEDDGGYDTKSIGMLSAQNSMFVAAGVGVILIGFIWLSYPAKKHCSSDNCTCEKTTMSEDRRCKFTQYLKTLPKHGGITYATPRQPWTSLGIQKAFSDTPRSSPRSYGTDDPRKELLEIENGKGEYEEGRNAGSIDVVHEAAIEADEAYKANVGIAQIALSPIFWVSALAFSINFTMKILILSNNSKIASIVSGGADVDIEAWNKWALNIYVFCGIPFAVTLSILMPFFEEWAVVTLLQGSMISTVVAFWLVLYLDSAAIQEKVLLFAHVSFALSKAIILGSHYFVLTSLYGVKQMSFMISSSYLMLFLWNLLDKYVLILGIPEDDIQSRTGLKIKYERYLLVIGAMTVVQLSLVLFRRKTKEIKHVQ